jgi:HNH endonuclease
MLTAKQLRQRLHYDPLTGIFIWKQWRPGQQTGKPDPRRKNGCRIYVEGKFYPVGRLAWLYVYGKHVKLIDHINCDPTDNRIINLRLATQEQNSQNRRRPKQNKSGFKGVYRKGNGWEAYIKRHKYLGTFSTPELAHEAYKRAARQSFGEFARFE